MQLWFLEQGLDSLEEEDGVLDRPLDSDGGGEHEDAGDRSRLRFRQLPERVEARGGVLGGGGGGGMAAGVGVAG